MKKLELENITYEWNEQDSWANDKGKTFHYASLKKITTYKGNKKYKMVTVKHEYLDRFKDFLKDIVGGSKDEDGSVPF